VWVGVWRRVGGWVGTAKHPPTQVGSTHGSRGGFPGLRGADVNLTPPSSQLDMRRLDGHVGAHGRAGRACRLNSSALYRSQSAARAVLRLRARVCPGLRSPLVRGERARCSLRCAACVEAQRLSGQCQRLRAARRAVAGRRARPSRARPRLVSAAAHAAQLLLLRGLTKRDGAPAPTALQRRRAAQGRPSKAAGASAVRAAWRTQTRRLAVAGRRGAQGVPQTRGAAPARCAAT
jgi:hypothetical protein